MTSALARIRMTDHPRRTINTADDDDGIVVETLSSESAATSTVLRMGGDALVLWMFRTEIGAASSATVDATSWLRSQARRRRK